MQIRIIEIKNNSTDYLRMHIKVKALVALGGRYFRYRIVLPYQEIGNYKDFEAAVKAKIDEEITAALALEEKSRAAFEAREVWRNTPHIYENITPWNICRMCELASIADCHTKAPEDLTTEHAYTPATPFNGLCICGSPYLNRIHFQSSTPGGGKPHFADIVSGDCLLCRMREDVNPAHIPVQPEVIALLERHLFKPGAHEPGECEVCGYFEAYELHHVATLTDNAEAQMLLEIGEHKHIGEAERCRACGGLSYNRLHIGSGESLEPRLLEIRLPVKRAPHAFEALPGDMKEFCRLCGYTAKYRLHATPTPTKPVDYEIARHVYLPREGKDACQSCDMPRVASVHLRPVDSPHTFEKSNDDSPNRCGICGQAKIAPVHSKPRKTKAKGKV
jgi:hypothetical protein